MLVLARGCNKRIRIGSEITITVISIQAGRVKLGIDAPVSTPVHREEVFNRIQRDEEDSRE